ncbi:MAG: response regulator [Candidatus Methylomirabilales bacterium]
MAGTHKNIPRGEEITEQIAQAVRDLERKNREVAEARDQALETARRKSEVLTIMSHEIRTPIYGINGMTRLLLNTDLSAEQRDIVETISSSGEALLTTITDILDFSKIEAGKLEIEIIDFDLRTAVEQVVSLLAARAQAKGLELACLVHHDVPTSLRGDPGRLRQVLTNLLGNAVKFTEKGEVILRARLAQETEDAVVVRFEISDTGIGISPEVIERLFHPFAQADSSTTRKHGGTGLGLAISKDIIELLGGEIGVESEPGKGSTFWFTMRLEKQLEIAPALPLPLGDLHGLRLLVVDDNAPNRTILRSQIISGGMASDVAENGPVALEMLRAAANRSELYNLAILDMQMPDMDGIQLARAIKADPTLATVRLILLTSFGQPGDAKAAHQAGAAAYLMKPVRQSQLFECIARVMGTPTERAAAPLITRHNLQEEKVRALPRVLIAEDNALNQKVTVGMLEEIGYKADVASNGREAVDALSRIQYDVVLMDCEMPEMDGFEATAKIRQQEGAVRHTPIIAITAHATDDHREKCLAAGMDDCTSKGVKTGELEALLRRWIVHRGQAPKDTKAE